MSTPERPVGVAWAPEPVHWSELKAGDVIEVGDALEVVTWAGAHPAGGYWVSTFGALGQSAPRPAPDGDPDPLVLVLVRRDALVGQVVAESGPS